MERRILPVRKNPASAGGAVSTVRQILTSKKFMIVLVQCLLMTVCVFADQKDTDVSAKIIDKLKYVVEILYSPWVKALFGIVVGAKAVSFIINHEQGTFKKLIPLAGAALIYFVAPTVANKLLDDTTGYTVDSDGVIKKG